MAKQDNEIRDMVYIRKIIDEAEEKIDPETGETYIVPKSHQGETMKDGSLWFIADGPIDGGDGDG